MTRTFFVLINFDCDVFLSACRAAGVKLSKETPDEVVDGFFERHETELTVTLYSENQGQMDIVEQKIREQ